MPLNLFYTMVQKIKKWPKTQIKGGPALKGFFWQKGKIQRAEEEGKILRQGDEERKMSKGKRRWKEEKFLRNYRWDSGLWRVCEASIWSSFSSGFMFQQTVDVHAASLEKKKHSYRKIAI